MSTEFLTQTAIREGVQSVHDLNAIDKGNAATVPGAVDPHRRQLGMTLIEIMIALLIGAFLLGGVMQIFVSSQQTNRMQENLSRLQENGRFALEFISKDIRRAGYWGCLLPSSPDVDIAGTNDNTANGDNIDDGTDTLTLIGAFVLAPTGTCGVSVAPALASDPSSRIFYKINGSTLQQDTNGQNNGLIEGIEDMQILYGVDTDTDGTANYYVSANNVANMAQVISIRISLLAATLDDNLADQPLTYSYNGVMTTAADRRIRRVFNTTVAVRNRLP
jgi:type IV pilus assembly protein PilW